MMRQELDSLAAEAGLISRKVEALTVDRFGFWFRLFVRFYPFLTKFG